MKSKRELSSLLRDVDTIINLTNVSFDKLYLGTLGLTGNRRIIYPSTDISESFSWTARDILNEVEMHPASKIALIADDFSSCARFVSSLPQDGSNGSLHGIILLNHEGNNTVANEEMALLKRLGYQKLGALSGKNSSERAIVYAKIRGVAGTKKPKEELSRSITKSEYDNPTELVGLIEKQLAHERKRADRAEKNLRRLERLVSAQRAKIARLKAGQVAGDELKTIVASISNATKQIEAYIGLATYLETGVLIPSLHGWPVSPDLAFYLVDLIESNDFDLVIEFGSGSSTLIMASALMKKSTLGGRLHSSSPVLLTFEHDSTYFEQTRDQLQRASVESKVDLRLTPLVPWGDGEGYLYYDCEKVLKETAHDIQLASGKILILVDGPPGSTGIHARYPAVPIVRSAFPFHDLWFVVDDAFREGERETLAMWETEIKQRGTYECRSLKFEKGGALLKWGGRNHSDKQIKD